MEKGRKEVFEFEFLKTIWISSCLEPRFYFRRKHSCYFFHGKDTKEVYGILEELTD